MQIIKFTTMNLGQVYTKSIVADYMVGLLDCDAKAKIIEPCFGMGVFIESLSRSNYANVIGYEIDSNSYEKLDQGKYPGYQFFNADFFSLEDRDIDAIIMNPPYVRQEEIDDMELLGVTKDAIEAKCIGFSIYSKANLYLYFVARSIHLLKDSGQIVAIFPNAWINTPDGKDFYRQMELYGNIDELIQVKGFPFVGNPLVDVLILKFTKGKKGETIKKTISVSDNEIKELGDSVSLDIQSQDCIPLSSIATIRRGISTGYNSVFINPDLTIEGILTPILSTPKDVDGFSTRSASLDKLLTIPKNYELPSELDNYIKAWESQIQTEGKPKTLCDKINLGQVWYKLIPPQPSDIIFPYIIRNSVRFIYNENHVVVRDNFYGITSKIDPMLLMALLNNKFVFSQLELFGKSYGNGLLKIQKYDMDNIVIPNPQVLDAKTKKQLMECAKGLVETNNIEYISETTSLLAKFYKVSNIDDIYASQKENRLRYEI